MAGTHYTPRHRGFCARACVVENSLRLNDANAMRPERPATRVRACAFGTLKYAHACGVVLRSVVARV